VALLRTVDRAVTGTVRDDTVEQGSLGVYAAHEFALTEQLRSYLGLRRDQYRFDVDSSLDANSGDDSEGITSTKASLAYLASPALELYASFGTGFHSNDARGTTITVDPVTGDPVPRVDALVASEGAELGARVHLGGGFQATLALWTLSLDSELLFVGDAGTTEANRPSQRDGVELGAYWYPDERYSLNLEAAYTDARFDDADPAGREIPGAIPLVVGGGITLHPGDGWMASVQVKHFGRYPLIEDNSVKSDGSTLVNMRLGREGRRWGLFLDVLNLLDRRDHDIDYFYASRLPGEPADGVEDIHFHLFPSREFRLSLRYAY
jgi:outer membrane receptor protein involved in Fe transport